MSMRPEENEKGKQGKCKKSDGNVDNLPEMN